MGLSLRRMTVGDIEKMLGHAPGTVDAAAKSECRPTEVERRVLAMFPHPAVTVAPHTREFPES